MTFLRLLLWFLTTWAPVVMSLCVLVSLVVRRGR
jgi:hypothetical protein